MNFGREDGTFYIYQPYGIGFGFKLKLTKKLKKRHQNNRGSGAKSYEAGPRRSNFYQISLIKQMFFI